MINPQITLEDILAGKEARYNRQKDFRKKYATALVSITINMPGPVKDLPILRRLRDYAVQTVRRRLNVIGEEQVNAVTGPEALLAATDIGSFIKKITVEIEEEYPFARLLDIDVFDGFGQLLSRQDQGQSRGCFVCGCETVMCMREQKHTQEDIQLAVAKMLNHFRAYETRLVSSVAEKLGTLAVEAMLYEVTCTPAPGLVDRVNSGAHQDMDFYSFMASSAALVMPMARCAQAGMIHEGSIESLLPVLRIVGLEGEKAMLAATNGINTQKGLIFLLGIMAGVAGWLSGQKCLVTAESVLRSTRQMVAGIVEKELMCAANKEATMLTAGEKLYIQYGITGIRGELEDGLPAVRNKALPALRQGLNKGLSINDALVQTLLILMTCVDDTTVMHRHDPNKMRIWVRQQVQNVLAAGGMETVEGKKKCEELDFEFIAHNVSPGGVADLLAVTWFLHRL
ncbi:triphosphoribosyl-dephospho-CoA synthase CitG [Pelosinus sp. sgz500959]|uniref:triphosphoribosyl-dephospho-CoA synthase CitG n=1 Tax=Pelosinus sp. sgz500959 TaxID=3242472 RepID=UPI0036714A43